MSYGFFSYLSYILSHKNIPTIPVVTSNIKVFTISIAIVYILGNRDKQTNTIPHALSHNDLRSFTNSIENCVSKII